MQLFSRKKALFAASLGALVALGACGDNVTVPAPVTTPEVVSVSPSFANLNVGEAAVFNVQITGGSATTPPMLASCATSNAAVATAALAGAACRATAVSAGNATITGTTTTGKSISAQVTVSAPTNSINTLVLTPTTSNISVGGSVTIAATVNSASSAVTVTRAYATSNAAIASVNATTGVVTGVAPGVATITVTVSGSGTGFTTNSLTSAVTVNVSANPPGVTALVVQPTSLALALGQTAQLTASATQPTGASAATVSYGTTAPAVATVNATTGLVTAVAPGTAVITVTATSAANANFAASTATVLVPVIVAPSANVTIQTVTQGPVVTVQVDSTLSGTVGNGILTVPNAQVNQPIDITNVRDQIQVLLNLQPNGQRVDSVVTFIANADGTNRRAAARQIFSTGTANQGDITLFVNTADFTADFNAGTSVVFYPNGQKIISASIFTTNSTGQASEGQNASNNRQTVNFNNLDGFAAQYTNPSRSAISAANNFTYWGGPDIAGTGRYAFAPVFYSAGRSVTQLQATMRQGLTSSFAVCDQAGQVTQTLNGTTLLSGQGVSTELYTVAPYSGSYNSVLGRMINGGGTTSSFSTATNGVIECQGYFHPSAVAQNFVGISAGTDNFNNPIPLVTRPDGFRFSVAVPKIVANRLDYAAPVTVETDIRRDAPTVTTANAIWAVPAITGWVNAGFNFQTSTAPSVDNGVGLPTTSSRTYRFWGCGAGTGTAATNPDTVSVLVPTTTGADIPECPINVNALGGWDPNATPSGFYQLQTRGPYRIGYIETDLLNNAAFSPVSRAFGVDKTAPLARFSTASSADTTFGTGTPTLQAEVIDERAGFVDNNDNGAKLRTAFDTTTYQPGNLSQLYGSFQHYATRGASSSNPVTLQRTSANNVNCINPNSVTAMIASTSNPFGASTTTAASGGATPITNPTCPFINQPNNGSSVGIFNFLSDGYRSATLVSLGNDGIYSYRAKVYDRAGNASAVLARSAAKDVTAPIFSDLNVPGSIVASTAPSFGSVIGDNVEVRAYNLSTLYPVVGSRFVYPQTLLNARFNDVINTPTTPSLALPTAAPFITALEQAFGTPPNTGSTAVLPTGNNITNLSGVAFDPSNLATTSATTPNFASVALPQVTGFSAINGLAGTPNYTSWSVLNTVGSFAPGFNAPTGLKAQLISNTNVTNQAFVRVEFFRFNGTTGQYEYLGQQSNVASADQGTTRFWTWTLTTADYAKRPTSLETAQSTVALNDNIIAIGVRSNGAGLATAAVTIGGAAINFTSITFINPPAGYPQPGSSPAANITVTGGSAGFTGTVSGVGILAVDAAGGFYTITANPVIINGVTYNPTPVSQTVTVPANTLVNQPVAITYTPVVLAVQITTNLPSGGTISVTLNSGAAVVTQSIASNGGLIAVPATGSYAVTANTSSLVIGSQTYNTPVVTGSPAVVTTSGSAPVANISYSSPAFLTSLAVGTQSAYSAETFANLSSIPSTNGGSGTMPGTITGASLNTVAALNIGAGFGGTQYTGFTSGVSGSSLTVSNIGVMTTTAPLSNGTFPTIPVALSPQATTFGSVLAGSSFFGSTGTATVVLAPAQLSFTITGQPSVINGTSPANWVLPATTVTGPNGYSAQFTGGAGPTYNGFQFLQIGGSTRTVLLPVASPGVGSYQLSIPNTQNIGGTTFTVSNCAAGAPTGSPVGTTGGAGAQVLSAAVIGGNCVISINAIYALSASPITINYVAP